MSKKGFTLVEILGVVVILGLLLMIIAPPMMERITSKKAAAGDAETKILQEAASMYFDKHKNDQSPKECVKIQTLVDEGYLNKTMTIAQTTPITGINKNGLKPTNGACN